MSISCPICQEDINFSDEEISVVRCGHLFHQRCLQQWLDTDLSCPECRLEVTDENLIKKIYPSVIEDADLVYKGSSDETKTILTVFNENNTNFQKLFLKRITNLENHNKDLADKNVKLEENLSITSTRMRALQNENKDKDEEIVKLINDNKELNTDIETLQQNLTTSNDQHQSAVKGLKSEINQLIKDNDKLKANTKTLEENLKTMSIEAKTAKEQNRSSFTDLEAENNKLRDKISSVLDVLLSGGYSNDGQSTSTS